MATPLFTISSGGSGPATMAGADGVKIEILGMKELQKKLQGMHPRMAKKLENQAARQAAYPVRDRAKSIVPFDEGALRSAIKVRALKKSTRWQRKYLIGAQVVIGKPAKQYERDNVWYGSMLEYGMANRNIPAQPFLRPAMIASEKIVSAIYRSALQRAINGEEMKVTRYRSGVLS